MIAINNNDAKILIIGAGPTGLTLAACLKKQGISADIIDTKSSPNTQSKALAINPIVQLQLDLLFEDSPIGKNALNASKVNIFFNNKRINTIDLKCLQWEKNKMLVQTQCETEKDLLSLVESLGVRVQWNTKAVKVEEQSTSVCVTIDSQGNEVFIAEYDYVIGCEGKRSLVREAIGATLEHKSYDMYLALADFKLETDLNQQSAHYFIYEDTFFVFVPLGNDLWRIVVKHNGEPKKGEHIHLVTDAVTQKFGKNIFLGECLWFSQAPLYVSSADKLQTEKLFIAGDAAHLYSPIGGTGMNTGMLDAINLAWKLAFSLKGLSTPLLLESYSIERVPAIKANAIATDHLTKLISRQLTEEQYTSGFMPKIKNRKILRNVLPNNLAGMNLVYEKGFIFQNESGKNIIGKPESNVFSLLKNLQTHLTDKTATIYILQLIDQDASDLSESVFQRTHSLGARDLILQWHTNNNSEDDKIQIKKLEENKTVIAAIPQQQWKSLATLGDIIAIRPDGILFFTGKSQDHAQLCSSLSQYIKTNIH